uniref:Kinesin motor domain-containing protein n=1 Tax=Oryzias sinensis TaxID=183150 RepID=A0A8C8DS36_9TELE
MKASHYRPLEESRLNCIMWSRRAPVRSLSLRCAAGAAPLYSLSILSINQIPTIYTKNVSKHFPGFCWSVKTNCAPSLFGLLFSFLQQVVISSVTGRGESFPASIRAVLNSEALEPVGFTGRSTGGDCRVKERPTPEGAGGSRESANMCQRTEDTPSSRCLQVGERFRMPFSGGTLRRAHPGGGHLGGSDRKVAGCDKCSATLVGLKKQALSLAVHHRFSCKVADDSTLSCSNDGVLQTSSRIQNISRVVTIANTAAMSFLSRAAEKLNLTLRKKNQASDPAPSNASTCFREIIQKNPPPVPTCLLQAAARTKDSPDVGKVKVVLRVSRMLSDGQFQPPVLRIDSSKKRVIVIEPASKNLSHSTMTLGRENRNPLKTFSFDAAYSQDCSQADLCAGVLADVIRCVLSGSDGCVLGLGCADVGSWSSMVGSGENIQKLGLIPCAISWLYSAIERRREKTWTELTVSVSAIELCCGEEDTLRDLLGEVVPSSGSTQDSPKAHVRVQEDPVCGIQVQRKMGFGKNITIKFVIKNL